MATTSAYDLAAAHPHRIFLQFATRTRKLSVPVRYGAVTCLVLAALGARRWLLGAEPGWPFPLSYPAIVLAGAVFDRGTGLYATALSAALGTYLFMPQRGQPATASGRDAVGLLVFLATASLTALLLEGMHAAFDRVTEAQRELERSNAALHSANSRLAKTGEQVSNLLHEAIHRFRNDLQRLSATVALQRMAGSEPAARSALAEVEARIVALGSIKARLDVTLTLEGEATFVESRAFLSGLLEDWAALVGTRPISFKVDVESYSLAASRAVLLGLVLNELVTNAVKYAFPDGRDGTVSVTFRRRDDHDVLLVEDDGEGHDPAASPKGTGLGRRITQSLAGQLGGRLEFGPREGGGTVCTMISPAAPL